MDVSDVKALIFDVFGTVVDWRSSLIKHGQQFGKVYRVEPDWDAFADAWRGKYRPFIDKVRNGELPWTNLEGLHRMALEEVLSEFNLTGVSEEAKAEFNLAWHDLRPWPDSVPGLYRLKHRFIIAPMSNGNVALITNMAKNGGLPWDCILGLNWPGPTNRIRRATSRRWSFSAPTGDDGGGASSGSIGGRRTRIQDGLRAAPLGAGSRAHPGSDAGPIL